MKVALMIWFALSIVYAGSFNDGISSVKRPLEASVSIQVDTGRGWRTSGSGTLIKQKKGYGVLTAKHVAEAEGILRACSMVEPEHCVILGMFSGGIGDELSDDWSIFPISKLPKGTKTAKIGDGPKIGEKIWIIGNPFGRHRFVSSGTVGAIEEGYCLASAFSAPGNSGGGVFDSRGRLIGILVAIPVEREPINGLPIGVVDMPVFIELPTL